MTATLPEICTFPAEGSSLSELRDFVRSRAEEAALSEGTTSDLLLAVTEACGELLAHDRADELIVGWWAHDGIVEIRVKDEGAVERSAEPIVLEEEGEFGSGPLGFPYILAFVDEYVVRPRTQEHPTTTIRMIKATNSD
jgi:anti-sigma regulatory factor (Ser/Thr protein kinase)